MTTNNRNSVVVWWSKENCVIPQRRFVRRQKHPQVGYCSSLNLCVPALMTLDEAEKICSYLTSQQTDDIYYVINLGNDSLKGFVDEW